MDWLVRQEAECWVVFREKQGKGGNGLPHWMDASRSASWKQRVGVVQIHNSALNKPSGADVASTPGLCLETPENYGPWLLQFEH